MLKDLPKIQKEIISEMKGEKRVGKGTRVKVRLGNMEMSKLWQLKEEKERPLVRGEKEGKKGKKIVFTKLMHERKITQIHVKLQRRSQEILKSKEEIEVQIGMRKTRIRPIYSQLVAVREDEKDKREYKE